MTAPDVEVLDGGWLDRHALEVTVLRRTALGRDTTSDASRARLVRTHARTPGCRVTAVHDAAGDLRAICYGFPLRPGQWWRDTVAGALGAPLAQRWLSDAVEVAELHVHPDDEGAGVGRAVLHAFLVDTGCSRVALSTHDAATRARAFYERAGFSVLRGGVTFPGDPQPYALLAADLPLDLGQAHR